MLTNTDILETKVTKGFYCEKCNYKCSKKSLWDKHIFTRKHKNTDKILTNTDTLETKVTKAYNCKCGKYYNHRQSLFNHKRNCFFNNNDEHNDKKINNENEILESIRTDLSDKNVIMQLLQQNKEFKDLLAEQNKLIIDLCAKQQSQSIELHKNSNNNNNINSHNKTFNLQVFLNETCKDAMNITDFVNSLKIQLSDLESIGSLGYVDGISKIIIKGLKELDETIRPIHCTDKKRETVYVKDENKWEKDENKTHIRKAINFVANENIMLIPQWKAKYPDYLDSSSIQSDKYNNMVIEVLGGDDDSKMNENKIIRKIAREVVIDKL